jgi:hypothetical protein
MLEIRRRLRCCLAALQLALGSSSTFQRYPEDSSFSKPFSNQSQNNANFVQNMFQISKEIILGVQVRRPQKHKLLQLNAGQISECEKKMKKGYLNFEGDCCVTRRHFSRSLPKNKKIRKKFISFPDRCEWDIITGFRYTTIP